MQNNLRGGYHLNCDQPFEFSDDLICQLYDRITYKYKYAISAVNLAFFKVDKLRFDVSSFIDLRSNFIILDTPGSKRYS